MGDSKIKRLCGNIIWGEKSNFIAVPTDCPQRNERLVWTGYAAVICPWQIYLAYINKKILENQFESMRKWVEYIHNFGEEEYLWIGGKHYGDWLALDNKEGVCEGLTSPDFIASAFFAYSTSLLIKAGNVLGHDMAEYEDLYKNIVNAFKERFIKPGIQKTQTAHVLALYFDLCIDKKETAKELANLVLENGTRLNTGFVGTPYLLYALSENGYENLAYDLLFQEKFPSWLFSVNQGATTVWEHWDGVKEDGSFWSKDMNSYNHYAYGAVFDWIFTKAAGINVKENGAGYKSILIKPIADRRMGFVDSSIDTRMGKVSSSWYFEKNTVHFKFCVPDGVSAEIVLPDGFCETVGGGEYLYTVDM